MAEVGENIVTDTLSHDSLGADTAHVAVPGEEAYVLVFEESVPAPPVKAATPDYGYSIIVAILSVLFVAVAVRCRANSKYISGLVKDMFEVRERANVFDDTVRETSFLILLNLLWCGSTGVLLAQLCGYFTPLGIALCSGVAAVYTLVMTLSYEVVGNIFSDARHTSMWVRGYTSGQGLSATIFFPLALLAICYSKYSDIWLLFAMISFIFVKIVFLWKGFRIFFTEIASWLLFLYYLCSLEIVPLILTYVGAVGLCSAIL